MLDHAKVSNAIGAAAALFAAVLCAQQARADGHVYDMRDPTYRAECGSCHVAYPPQLLPASAWRTLMSGLDRHFGTDATVAPQAAAHIGAYLDRNAGGARRPPAANPPRISEAAWFKREHRRAAARFADPRIKSAANCGACHVSAESGDYSENSLRVPR
jgi:hypothetical protein